MLKRWWQDSAGGVISGEMVIAGAIVVVGLIVGLSAVKYGILTEVSDVGKAVHSIDFTPKITPIPDTLTSPDDDGVSDPTTASDVFGQ